MLATGGSAVAALDLLRRARRAHDRIVAARRIALVERHHPDVHIYTPVVDIGLNDHSIVPGPRRLRRSALRTSKGAVLAKRSTGPIAARRRAPTTAGGRAHRHRRTRS
jgi:hypothetical protein